MSAASVARMRLVRTVEPVRCGSSLHRESWLRCWPLEIVVFSVIGTNFASLANGFEVLRLSVEIGLVGAGADTGDHQRRHRSFGRLADGSFGRRFRQALARRRAADRRRRGAWRLA